MPRVCSAMVCQFHFKSDLLGHRLVSESTDARD
uniref:Uncharacterized protein n=1 Tax=Nelumbo nucifera TaxID=4432 RepID=A0A822YHZ5_NELNU|nr:TPA_asm: hypothetical protein HUJ06_012665 [Nelumbo nucifera]